MDVRKLLAALVGLMFLIGLPAGHCGNARTVILVSDNPADGALAALLGNLTGWKVVVTPWGVYNSSVLTELLALAPSRVVIIGGPLAVPEAYEEALKELGINVTRWWGQTRYGTDSSVVGNATELGLISLKTVVVVPGNDTAAILKAREMAVRLGVPILYVNETPWRIEFLLRRAGNVTLVASPGMLDFLRAMINGTVRKVSLKPVNLSPELVFSMLEDARERVRLLSNLSKEANLSELEEERVKHELDGIEGMIREAESLYNSGRYEEAYRLLTVVQYREQRLLAEVGNEWWYEVQHDMRARGDFTFTVIGSGVEALKKLGMASPEMTSLLKALREALKEGNEEKAQALLQRLLELLRRSYVTLGVAGGPSFPPSPAR